MQPTNIKKLGHVPAGEDGEKIDEAQKAAIVKAMEQVEAQQMAAFFGGMLVLGSRRSVKSSRTRTRNCY